MSTELRDRLLSAVQEAYSRYVADGPRSTSKIKALHGWVISELENVLGHEYQIKGLSDLGGRESKVEGRYYPKNVDVAISRSSITLGVVSVKFVMTNYRQNKNNYFEQQLGETANLRSNDIVFGHIMLRTHPTPYLKRGGEVKHNEKVDNGAIELYAKLAEDHGKHHVPDIQCMAAFSLSDHRGEIIRQCTEEDLPDVLPENFRLLETRLSIDRFFERMKDEIQAKHSRRRDQ